LKNEKNTLPLRLKPSTKIAMIGFWADAPDKLSGGYSGTPYFEHSPAFAARRMGLDIKVASGPILHGSSSPDNWTAPALEAAKDADYVLYFGGLDTSAAGETKDRMTINWPSAQLSLLDKLSKLGKPLVVVQMGDQVDNTPILQNKGINSILWANWPGQDGGEAVMQLISGAKSPAGRLPVTQYPANYTELVPMTEMNLRPNKTDGSPGRTYRWYPTPVQPFGFGLHYTEFDTKLTLAKEKKFTTTELVKACKSHTSYIDTCPFRPLQVRVTNKGKKHTSDYVALTFLSGDFGPEPRPIKTLAAYTRVRDLKPGQTAEAELQWTLGNLARHDEKGNTVLYPGKYTVTLDVEDKKPKASVSFTITGEPVVLDEWPSPPSKA